MIVPFLRLRNPVLLFKDSSKHSCSLQCWRVHSQMLSSPRDVFTVSPKEKKELKWSGCCFKLGRAHGCLKQNSLPPCSWDPAKLNWSSLLQRAAPVYLNRSEYFFGLLTSLLTSLFLILNLRRELYCHFAVRSWWRRWWWSSTAIWCLLFNVSNDFLCPFNQRCIGRIEQFALLVRTDKRGSVWKRTISLITSCFKQ